MKLFPQLLFFIGLALASCSVLQFGAMIKHQTGKSLLSYSGYGCLKASKEPLDATDRCCHAHNCCYEKLAASHCSPEWVSYNYLRRESRKTCGKSGSGDPRGEAQPPTLTQGTGNCCQTATCACDKAAAECFQRAAGSYHSSYKNYPSSKCKGQTPSC